MNDQQTKADRRQAKDEKLKAFTADLIALCAKHGVTIEGSESCAIDVDLAEGSSPMDRHLGTIGLVDSKFEVDTIIETVGN